MFGISFVIKTQVVKIQELLKLNKLQPLQQLHKIEIFDFLRITSRFHKVFLQKERSWQNPLML